MLSMQRYLRHLHRTVFGAHLPWRSVPGVKVRNLQLISGDCFVTKIVPRNDISELNPAR